MYITTIVENKKETGIIHYVNENYDEGYYFSTKCCLADVKHLKSCRKYMN
jgi:hypothetical protein